MIINYKYRIYPNKTQEKHLDKVFFLSNQVWNYALNLKIKDLKHKKDFTPQKSIEKYIKTKLIIRNYKLNSGILQQSAKKLDKTLKEFFDSKRKGGNKGFPKFKKSHYIKQSFEFKNQGISLTDKYFKIMKMIHFFPFFSYKENSLFLYLIIQFNYYVLKYYFF